jgi:hypothetical protein
MASPTVAHGYTKVKERSEKQKGGTMGQERWVGSTDEWKPTEWVPGPPKQDGPVVIVYRLPEDDLGIAFGLWKGCCSFEGFSRNDEGAWVRLIGWFDSDLQIDKRFYRSDENGAFVSRTLEALVRHRRLDDLVTADEIIAGQRTPLFDPPNG